jgi:hypothetical protein
VGVQVTSVDWAAVNRRLDFISRQVSETRDMIESASAGGYSPLMSSAAFEEQFHLAIKATGATAEQICIFNMPRPHRCNRCETFVEHFMNRSKADAVRA